MSFWRNSVSEVQRRLVTTEGSKHRWPECLPLTVTLLFVQAEDEAATVKWKASSNWQGLPEYEKAEGCAEVVDPQAIERPSQATHAWPWASVPCSTLRFFVCPGGDGTIAHHRRLAKGPSEITDAKCTWVSFSLVFVCVKISVWKEINQNALSGFFLGVGAMNSLFFFFMFLYVSLIFL